MYVDKKYKTSSSKLALILKILDLISVNKLQLCLEKKSNQIEIKMRLGKTKT